MSGSTIERVRDGDLAGILRNFDRASHSGLPRHFRQPLAIR